MKKQEKIVIVGYGWVGQANALAFAYSGYTVSYFDPNPTVQHYKDAHAHLYTKITPCASVAENDSEHTIYVVCVGDTVNDEGVQDIHLIESVLESLRTVKGTVVLRATVIPDTLERLHFDYYVPEFLHEKYAVEECITPYYVVVGKNDGTKKPEPSFLPLWRKHTPLQFEGTPREAAFVKYLSNLWNATRIAFVNEFGDTITTPRTLKDVDSIHRVINFVLREESYLKYGRSFDGHCLPKDSRAFAHAYQNKGSGTSLMKGVIAANNAHALHSAHYKDLPEWFSAWPTSHLSGIVAFRELVYSIKKNIRDPREFIDRYYTLKRGLLIIITLLILWGILLTV